MMALDLKPGDEVITTPFTFFATASCITRNGATPVFADVDPVTYNINSEDIIAKITPRTKEMCIRDSALSARSACPGSAPAAL